MTSVDLSHDDVNELVMRLIYDGKLYPVPGGDGEEQYRAVKSGSGKEEWTEIPCGKCPVAKFCSESGPVSPKVCVYFRDWLEI